MPRGRRRGGNEGQGKKRRKRKRVGFLKLFFFV